MKKVFALVLALVLVCCSFAFADENVLYHGFGTTTSVSVKDATADADGQVQVNTAMASVVVDANGVIVSVILDTQQTTVKMNNTGVVTTDVTAAFPTKVEKGDAYGMRATSEKVGIGKEYNEQIDGLEQWLIGKTVADFKAAIEGKDETLLAVATITLDTYVTAIEKAVNVALGL